MGTPSFAVPSLKILLENKFDIASVVTIPDKKKGRGQIVTFSEVKKFADEKNLNLLQPENLKDDNFINAIKKLNPDLIIVVAFKILPKEIFTIPKYGSVNLHASLLPKYRGAAPINWAIINGEKETGVTTFFLKEKVDTGNIIVQEKTSIEANDDAGTLHDKLSALGAQVILKTVNLISSGNIKPLKQDDTLASPAPKLFKEDCLINWNQEAVKVQNFIRGLSPYPAAYSFVKGKIIKVYKSLVSKIKTEIPPGLALIKEKKLFVSSKDYFIEIIELKHEGKRRMTALDFLNGIKEITEDIHFENSKYP